MAEKKQSVLALLDVLRRCSDEEHPLTVNEIKQHLENEYDLTLERRTIYSNIELLSQNGYEVSTYEDNRKGYYLLERQFDVHPIQIPGQGISGQGLHGQSFKDAKQTASVYDRDRFDGHS